MSVYSDVFCKVYNVFGWNYYPEAFGEQLLLWLKEKSIQPVNALDMGCGTGILCRCLTENGISARGMDLSPGMIRIAREENPGIPFDVGDMTDYHPGEAFDLVTCTGDALNHLSRIDAVDRVFGCVWELLTPGGYFVFDVLDEKEVSDSEPFEMDFTETTRVWFQMTRPESSQVNLCIRVYEAGILQFEENIQETLHDPMLLCRMLQNQGLEVVHRGHRLTDSANDAATWYLIARKPLV